MIKKVKNVMLLFYQSVPYFRNLSTRLESSSFAVGSYTLQTSGQGKFLSKEPIIEFSRFGCSNLIKYDGLMFSV